jgi:hypothetical protein
MDMKQFIGGQFLTKDDVTTRGTDARIQSVVNETVGRELETKPVLYFVGNSMKPMVLNKTNIKTLGAMYGYESTEWKGQEVNVFNDVTQSFNGVIGGLRIRPTHNYAHDAAADNRSRQQQLPFDDDVKF